MMAIKYAYKRPGISPLSTPTDVLIEEFYQPTVSPDKKIFRNRTMAGDENIRKAAELINSSRRVAMVARWRVKNVWKSALEACEFDKIAHSNNIESQKRYR